MEVIKYTILEIARQRTYLYDDNNQICYKWNCKVGCTLLKYLCLMNSPYKNEFLKFSQNKKMTFFEAIAVFSWENKIELKQQPEKFKNYKKVFICRNPITRFISCYNHLVYRNNYKNINPDNILKQIISRNFDKKIKEPIDHIVCHLIPQNFKNDAHFFSMIDLKSENMQNLFSDTYGDIYHDAKRKLEICGHHKNKKILLRLECVNKQKELCDKIMLADEIKDIVL
jgi:hypothetical protein